MIEHSQQQHPFQDYIDLVAESFCGQVLYANDEFFAPKENLIKTTVPIFIPDKYTAFGKWMDGWETRRRRVKGHDWCVLKLGSKGKVVGVDVDTSYFIGNFPSHISLDACSLDELSDVQIEQYDGNHWQQILPKAALQGGSHNYFTIVNQQSWQYLRLNIYPDGGVARLRLYGIVTPELSTLRNKSQVDLIAARHGGKALGCNDMFFSKKDNLIMPGNSKFMGDGWETRRRRDDGFDWIIVKCFHPGKIKKIKVDTSFFKGNYPDRCSVEALYLGDKASRDVNELIKLKWQEILPQAKLKADCVHVYEKELLPIIHAGVFDHVKLNIYPDGGIARFRVYGDLV